MTLADRIVVMRDGGIEQLGTPLDIYSDPASYFVADFLGSPSMNLLRGEVAGENGAAIFRTNGLALELPPALAAAAGRGGATLGVRPEHVEVGAGGDRRLRVGLVEPLGKDTLLYFNTGSERPFVAVCEGLAMAAVRSGEEVGIAVDPARLYLFDEDGVRLRPMPA